METVFLITNRSSFRLILLVSLLITVSCNRENEQIFYENGELKKEWSEHNAKKLIEYYRDGQVRKIQNWVYGKLEGQEVSYHGNGRIAQVFHYKNNHKVGKAKLYLPSGKLIEIQYYDSLGNKVDYESFNKDGSRSQKMTGIINSKKDTIFKDEVFEVSVRLGNITTQHYNRGELILTSGWGKNGHLVDTLDYITSDSNYYELKVKPLTKGYNEIYMCLFYKIPLDTIDGTLVDRYCYEKTFYVIDSISAPK